MSEIVLPPPDRRRARIVTRRRETPFRWGIVLAIGGLAATIGGGILLAGDHAIQIAAASDRAEIPEALVFSADERTYEVVLLADPGRIALPSIADPIAQLRCNVDRSDGTHERLGGDETVRIETSFGTSIGSFDARPGRTTVTCNFLGEPATSNYFLTVAPHRDTLRTSALVLMVAGVATMAAGTALIILGVRGRAVAV